MALSPIMDQGFRFQVYTKEEFHMEPPQVNSKALAFRGRSVVRVQQSWNSNSILGLCLVRFHCITFFGNTEDAGQTLVCGSGFQSFRIMHMSL